MWTLSSPLLMTSSVKSFLVPKGSSFTSSTTPLVFVSVWRSYLGKLPSSCCAFCENPKVTYKSRNNGTSKTTLMALGGRTGMSRLGSTALLVAHGKPNAEDGVPLYLRRGPEKDVHRFPGCLIVFANDKDVYSATF